MRRTFITIAAVCVAFAIFYTVTLMAQSNKSKDDMLPVGTSVETAVETEAEAKDVVEETKKYLDNEEDKVFQGKDISDKAVSKTDLTDDMMKEIIEEEDFFSLYPYRELKLYNIHTKEEIEIIYWANGEYIPEALDKLDWFLRDWRRNVDRDMDPALYDVIHELYQEVGAKAPIHIISGYRSQKTNDSMRAAGRGVAKKSQHIQGKAMDVTIPGVPVNTMRKEALALERGGVGYYPKSGFVHVDTGRVRQW